MQVFQPRSDRQPLLTVDLFVHEPFDFLREYAHAPRMEIPDGLVVPVVSLATLLAMKREAARHKDLDAIENLTRETKPPSAT